MLKVTSECLDDAIEITFKADINNINDLADIVELSNYVEHMHDKKCTCKEKNDNDEFNEVNHPSHYCQDGSIECIDEMLLLYGKGETMSFCKLNAHKYRKRAFDKGGIKDIGKSDWYIKKYMELKQKHEYDIIDEIKQRYS